MPVGCSSSRNSARTRNKSKYKIVTLHNLVQAVQFAQDAVRRQSKCAIPLIYRDLSKAAPINASQCSSDRGQSVEQEQSVTTLRSGWLWYQQWWWQWSFWRQWRRVERVMMISLILSHFFTSFYCFCGRLKKARCNLAKNWPILIQEPLRSEDWIHLKCFSIISYVIQQYYIIGWRKLIDCRRGLYHRIRICTGHSHYGYQRF